ncbi:RNA-binding protein [Chryseolinea sp. T2]|uniref:RNA recognition motif domain-containing protein n=1 Tax=Chryseolinea sp. T2 TaxID=3129255 RepID=UPI0030789A42
MNIYVANIPFKATDAELKELFEQHGEVASAKIVIDKMTNRSRGFGFVEMTDGNAAKEAINDLNGAEFQGKSLVVNEARPKTDSYSGSNGSGGAKRGYGGKSFGNRW